MRALRKILSVLLLLVIIPLLVAQITLQSVRTLLVDPAIPKRVMREAGVYAQVEQTILQGLMEQVRAEPESLPLPPERVSRIINRVLPAERVAQVSEQLIDGLYDWAWGTDPQPVLLLDLSDVRRALPQAVRAELENAVDALPVCNAAQLRELLLNPPSGMPPCKTADKKVNDAYIDRAVKGLDVDALVPRQIDLAVVIAGEEGAGFWEQAWQDLQPIRIALNLVVWGWGVITLLILLLALLNLDRWHTPFGWVGAAGVLAGGPLALVGLGGTSLLAPLLQAWLPLEAASATTVVALTLEVMSEAVRNVSFTILLLGLGAIAIAVYGKMTQSPSEGAAL